MFYTICWDAVTASLNCIFAVFYLEQQGVLLPKSLPLLIGWVRFYPCLTILLKLISVWHVLTECCLCYWEKGSTITFFPCHLNDGKWLLYVFTALLTSYMLVQWDWGVLCHWSLSRGPGLFSDSLFCSCFIAAAWFSLSVPSDSLRSSNSSPTLMPDNTAPEEDNEPPPPTPSHQAPPNLTITANFCPFETSLILSPKSLKT